VIRTIQTTAERLVRGEPATGWKKLSDVVGREIAIHIGKWFGESSNQHRCEPSTSAFSRDSLNDVGNAARSNKLFGDDLIYVPQLRKFFVWRDGIWAEDVDDLKTLTLCLHSVEHYLSNVSSDNEKVIKFLRSSKNHGRLNAHLKLLRCMVACDLSELDSAPHLIGCLNGMIDVNTGSHLPADRNAKITKRLSAEFDPEATCSTFEKLVHDMLGGDKAKIGFLQELCGYWLTGLTKYHYFPILWGQAGCGKSKFVNAITSVLGD
jgi:putative DNA primase/helicase